MISRWMRDLLRLLSRTPARHRTEGLSSSSSSNSERERPQSRFVARALRRHDDDVVAAIGLQEQVVPTVVGDQLDARVFEGTIVVLVEEVARFDDRRLELDDAPLQGAEPPAAAPCSRRLASASTRSTATPSAPKSS